MKKEKEVHEYKVDASMRVDLTVWAESFKEAEKLIDQYLGPASGDVRVEVDQIDSIEIEDIYSDTDDEEEE